MLDKIIYFSIHNKLVVGTLTAVLVVCGIYSLSQLPIDAVPDITNNQVQVLTVSPSLAAQEVERLVTFPVENSLATIPRTLEIRSISRFGLSVVTIVFKDNVDIYWARQQVTERLNIAMEQIPAGVGKPELAPVTTGLGEIYQYILHTQPGFEKKYPAMELRSIQDWIVRRQLLGTEGVADVSSFGGFLKQYEISIDPFRLKSFNLSIDDIFRALEENNQNTGGAYIDKKPNAYFIRSEGLIRNLDDIAKIQVTQTANGLPLLIRDLASVQLGSAVRYGAMTMNDDGEVVGGLVLMLKGANSSKVIGNVKERIEQIRKSLPEGVVLEPFLDRTKLVNNAIHTVSKNLIEGALIVIFVLVLLLGNLRAGLLVASVIPLSMLFAVSLMHLFGVSGNLMSLGAIDFGLIVDGTVIIVEATMRHILIKRYSHRLSQAEMDQEVYESASKIRNSAAFGEIIILIVYLPILALVGIEGKMFRPMAQTVSFAILGAFILSLTYVPMISALLLSKQNEHKPSISDSIIAWFHRLYLPALTFALKRKILVVFTSFALFVSALFLFTNMGAEFIPQLDEGDFAVELRVLQGSSLSETVEVVQKAAGLIKKHFPDEVVEVVGKIGSSEIPTDPMPLEAGDVMVILKDRKMWKKAASREELAEQMQAMLVESVPGATFGFQQPIQMRFNELISGVKQDVAVKIFGEDLGVLGLQAQKIGKLAGKVEGVEDLYVEEMDGLPQIVVHFDRDKLARFGVSIARANNIINTAFAGRSAGLVYEGERRFDLVVRLDQLSRSRIEDVRKLFITNARGEHVPLDQVATVEMQRGANQIQREDAKRRITVAFNVRGRDVESIVNELKARIDREVQLPTGYFITYGGQFQNLQEANKRLVVAVPMAIFLIFILLYFTFRSLKQSLLILLAIPLSSIGGIAALWLRGMPFSISAGIGFIALFGVAVLNGIVLIGEFNQLRKEGMHDLRSIILKGTETRLRPVLMTALVASLGFLPMALSNSAGAEVQKPLATVVIGGLVSATLLTLLVLPALYIAVENWSAKRRGTAVLPLTFLGGVLFLLPATPASAQVPERRITLAQALQEASGRNLEIRSEEYQIEHFKAMQGTAVDMPRTDITWMGGQYNSLRFDNNISVSQAFAHPKVAAKKRELLGAQVSAIQDKAAMVRNEISRQVKQTYYSLVITRQKEYLLEQERLWTGRFLRAAELRFRSGETGALERSAAQAEMGDVQLRILQNTKNRKLLSSRLQMLLTSPVSVLPADDSLRRRSRFIMRADSALLTDNPYIQFIRGQAQVEQKAVSVAKTLLLPGFSAGYFNQSLIGAQNVKGTEVFFGAGKRFQGFQLGIMIPVFNGANKARIRASELNVKLAQNNVALAESQLNNALRQAMMTYEQADESLSLYEQNSLVLAEVMRNNASKAYETGEIGYLELIRAFNKALMIRLTYLDLLEAFNHSVTEIEFLLNRP